MEDCSVTQLAGPSADGYVSQVQMISETVRLV